MLILDKSDQELASGFFGPYGVVWHEGPGREKGEVFDNLDKAKNRFAELVNGPYAAMLADSRSNEVDYYGGDHVKGELVEFWHQLKASASPYWVLWHVDWQHVEGDHFGSYGAAQDKFDEMHGGPYATMLADNNFKEMKYYGGRGPRPGEMREFWQHEQACISMEVTAIKIKERRQCLEVEFVRAGKTTDEDDRTFILQPREVVTEVRGAQTEHLLGVQFVTDQGRESSMYGDDSTGKKFAFKAQPDQFVAGLLLASGACSRITGLSGCRKKAIDPSLKLQDWMGSKGVCDRWGGISVDSYCKCTHDRRISQRCGWPLESDAAWVPGGCFKGTCRWWDASCKCEDDNVIWNYESVRLPTTDVGVAAVDFCSRLFEEVTKQQLKNGKVYYGMSHTNANELPGILSQSVKNTLRDHNAEQYCKAALSGRYGKSDVRPAVDQLVHRDQQPTTTKAPSRYTEIVKIETESTSDKSSWQNSLQHVCQEECKEILAAIKDNASHIFLQEVMRIEPFESACSDFVVKRVEAHLMGCCEKACGWNGRVCTYWPFMRQPSKVRWQQECCSEWNTIRFSDREIMCDSVLPKEKRTLMELIDAATKNNGQASEIGQDLQLFWTEMGAKSRFGRLAWARPNTEVNPDFLSSQPLTVKEGADLKFWEIKVVPRPAMIQLKAGAAQPVDCTQVFKSCGEVAASFKSDCAEKDKWYDLPPSELTNLMAVLSSTVLKEPQDPIQCHQEFVKSYHPTGTVSATFEMKNKVCRLYRYPSNPEDPEEPQDTLKEALGNAAEQMEVVGHVLDVTDMIFIAKTLEGAKES
ncbi:unnamed protein product [Symbiodinium necroappetens]|uniref:Jacalin-type lectin domain-containing protein n=1 Tax=Symbiodinium necroappetens TaxID=1628268 RepID=A0A812M8C8_9DINO|nr:unnamed protein product [Symbiodinium necroappetens]